MNNLSFLVWFTISISACNSPKDTDLKTLFTEMPSSVTGIKFENKLHYDEKFNIYTYRNFYNGGGIAIGDINNDGLSDLYFSSNMETNKLYLNKGNFVFEDITEKAGVGGKMTWSTGVTMADVNGDGYLDIYVCNSGDVNGEKKQNELFINNKDNTFSEQAETFGLADRGYSTHAVFFDYDKDNDLDMYLLNNSYKAIGSFNLKNNVRNVRDKEGGDKLFRNDGNKFVDVSESAGIFGSVIGFGLGVTVGDVNLDGWTDIYVSNDFFERDYLYINNQDGTFLEVLPQKMKSISVASMGADMADINNDCFPDIFVTEMLPGTDKRLKTKTTFENWDKFQYNLANGYHSQFTRNMLHLNQNGDHFLEVGRFSNVQATDWSWGALINDFDNDGFKDIFVANGIYQDLTDQDFLNFIGSEEAMKSIIKDNKVDYKQLIEAIPSEPISNYLFKNQNGLNFVNIAESAGIGKPSFSNGSAYGDLDNDGDLDLVVNNVNMPAFVYKNNVNTPNNKSSNYIQFKFKGNDKNTFAIGTKIILYSDQKMFYSEFMPMKGFESSMDYRVHFGLGSITKLDSAVIIFSNDKFLTKINPTINSINIVNEGNNHTKFDYTRLHKSNGSPLLKTVPLKNIDFVHKENQFVDFDKDGLIPQMMSTLGPACCVADFNNDKLDDIYFGGAKDYPGELYIQNSNGSFQKLQNDAFVKDKECEDVKSIAFDANNDGKIDLYVASGGNEYSAESSALKDRLYINDGKGRFTRQDQMFSEYKSTLAVTNSDFDNDGDEDLFVGEYIKMFNYGVPCSGKILRNDHGVFKDVTADIAPELNNIGMITDAVWIDINQDKAMDLVIVGHYMPVSIFINQNGKLINKTQEYGLSKSNGWYNTIKVADLNNDNLPDFILGNHGTNSKFKASFDHPVCMNINDFDKNGSTEQIICTYEGENSYPIVLKHDLVKQLPFLKKKYLKYSSYINQKMDDIFTSKDKENMIQLNAYELNSFVLINKGKSFEKITLPSQAQFSTMYSIYVTDLNNDKNADLLLGGNLYAVKPEIGRYDASNGLVLIGNGTGNFKYTSFIESGLKCEGEIRNILPISIAGKQNILIARNSESPVVYELFKQKR